MFTAPKLTNAGKALYYDNMGGTQIRFTTLQMGKGSLSGPIAAMTALVSPVITITAAVAVNDGYVDVSGQFSNASLTEGFYWREIGVFAANPEDPDNRGADILYCYQNAYDTADFIPLASVETVEKSITVPVIVGDAENVSCTLSASLIYATLQDLNAKQDKITAAGLVKGDGAGNTSAALKGTDYAGAINGNAAMTDLADADYLPLYDASAGAEKKTLWSTVKSALKSYFDTLYGSLSTLTGHINNTGNPHSVTASQVGLGSVPNVTTNNQTPTYTAASTLAALVSGEALSTAFGKIAKAVTSLLSHLSDTGNPHSVTYSQAGAAAASHTHTKSQITDFPALGTAAAKDVPISGNAGTTQVVMGSDSRLSDSRPAADVSAWAKAAAKPSYTAAEVGADASGAAAAAVSAHNNAEDAHSALFASIRKVGDIVITTRNDLGEKYLLCNGDIISGSTYPELYSKTRVYGIDTDFPSVHTNSYTYANSGVIEYNGYLIKLEGDPSGGIKLYYVALGGNTWTTVSIPYPNNMSTVTTVFGLQVVNGILCFLVFGSYTYIAFSTDITTWKYMRINGSNPTAPRLIYAFDKYVMLYTSSSNLYLYYSSTLVEDITNFWTSNPTGKAMSAIGDVCFDGTTLMVADQGTNTTLHCYYATSVSGAFSQVPASSNYFNIIAIYRLASCWLLVSKRSSSFHILIISDLTVAPLEFLLNTDTTSALSLFIDNILILIQGGTYYYLDTTNFSPDDGITALATWAYGSMKGFDTKYTSQIPGNSIITGQVGTSAVYLVAKFEKSLPTISNLGVYTYIKAKE